MIDDKFVKIIIIILFAYSETLSRWSWRFFLSLWSYIIYQYIYTLFSRFYYCRLARFYVISIFLFPMLFLVDYWTHLDLLMNLSKGRNNIENIYQNYSALMSVSKLIIWIEFLFLRQKGMKWSTRITWKFRIWRAVWSKFSAGPFNFEAGKTLNSFPTSHLNPYSWSKVKIPFINTSLMIVFLWLFFSFFLCSGCKHDIFGLYCWGWIFLLEQHSAVHDWRPSNCLWHTSFSSG